MRERAIMLGGWLDVDSVPGAGTLLTAELPLSMS
jgi:signal transduction histidine kinase